MNAPLPPVNAQDFGPSADIGYHTTRPLPCIEQFLEIVSGLPLPSIQLTASTPLLSKGLSRC